MSKPYKFPKDSKWHDDMIYALDTAADMIESWEYGGADNDEEYERQKSAAEEAAKRIRAMAKRYERTH